MRIVGGTWRGRRLPVADRPGLRPSGDRVRETLFNWLQPWLPGSRCLDCFAGSGALGFEALSRGAERVVLLERDDRQVRQLRVCAATLGATGAEIHCVDALRWLTHAPPTPFDVAFLDPPFADDLLTPVCAALAARGWLTTGAWVYLESAARAAAPRLPEGWTLWREKALGAVRMDLATAGEA